MAWKLSEGMPPHVEADDLAQEGALAMMSAAGRFDPTLGVPFRVFCRHRVRGAMIDALRKLPEGAPETPELPARNDTRPDIMTRRRELRTMLGKAAGSLPHKHRDVIRGEFAGLTLREIGERMGVTTSAVCAMRQRAFSGMRTQLARRGVFGSGDLI